MVCSEMMNGAHRDIYQAAQASWFSDGSRQNHLPSSFKSIIEKCFSSAFYRKRMNNILYIV
jgi:hypothetical protein